MPSSSTIAGAVTAYCFWAILAIIVEANSDPAKKPSRFVEFLVITGLGPWMLFVDLLERVVRWLFDPATRK